MSTALQVKRESDQIQQCNEYLSKLKSQRLSWKDQKDRETKWNNNKDGERAVVGRVVWFWVNQLLANANDGNKDSFITLYYKRKWYKYTKNTNTNKRRVVNQLLANANYGNKDSFIFGKEGQRERVKIQLQNYKHICKYTMVQIREENFWQLRTGWTKTDVQTAWG